MKTSKPYQVSKWVYQRGLLSLEELEDLLKSLGDLSAYPLGKVLPRGSVDGNIDVFAQAYEEYLNQRREKKIKPSLPTYALTVELDAIDTQILSDERIIVKPCAPIVEVRHYTYLITSDGRIQSLVYGPDSVSFGLQFAYPTLFIDPETGKLVEVLKQKENPNTILYKQIAKWFRMHTKPAPLQIGKKTVNAPFRIGKKCDCEVGV